MKNSEAGITRDLLEKNSAIFNYTELEDGSEEWLEFRKNGLGSSDIGSAMGMKGSFKSAVELWALKTGKIQEPERDEETLNRFYFGHASEPMIAQRFIEDFPQWEVENTGTYTNRQRPFMIINPDRLVRNKETGEIAVLEIKTSDSGYGWDGDAVPQYYVAQVRYQLSGMGLATGFIAVKIGNTKFRVYRIPLEAAEPITNMHTGAMYYELSISEVNILACAEGFMRCVEQDITPQIDGSVSAWNTVKDIHPNRHDETKHFVPEELAREVVQARRDSEAATANYQRLKNQLANQAGSVHRICYTGADGEEHQLARRDKARGGGFILKVLER